jgi:hypothetical protein
MSNIALKHECYMAMIDLFFKDECPEYIYNRLALGPLAERFGLAPLTDADGEAASPRNMLW